MKAMYPDTEPAAVLGGIARAGLVAFARLHLLGLGRREVGAPAAIVLGDGICLVLLDAKVVAEAVCLEDADVALLSIEAVLKLAQMLTSRAATTES